MENYVDTQCFVKKVRQICLVPLPHDATKLDLVQHLVPIILVPSTVTASNQSRQPQLLPPSTLCSSQQTIPSRRWTAMKTDTTMVNQSQGQAQIQWLTVLDERREPNVTTWMSWSWWRQDNKPSSLTTSGSSQCHGQHT
uniref:Uncharacterized protein n=1 Tax=Arundo donax TaxID=35708 RepID=A0A0A9CT45_ARUDO